MNEPFVGIVVPVYNGGEYLRECLTSIAAQTHANWVAVVVNNCSKDDTGAIAEEFARRDPRFHVEHCTEFLPQSENYNRAAAAAPAGAQFVKFVEADNWITPDCLSRMLEVACRDPDIGIVGAYYLKGLEVMGGGIAYNISALSGTEVCRVHLLNERIYYLGTPTTLLYRAEALRSVSPCFQPGLFYDDVDLCFRILRHRKFGFVHQVLSFLRVDNQGIMSRYVDLDFLPARQRLLLEDFGSDCLTPEEWRKARRAAARTYHRHLGRALVTGRSSEYWAFHRNVFRRLGLKLSVAPLCWPAVLAILDVALNPKNTCERIVRRIRRMAPKPRATCQRRPDPVGVDCRTK